MAKALTITCDASPLTTFAELLQLGLKFVHAPLGICDPPLELVRFEHDTDPARADELVVRLYPSDALLCFTAACLAGNLNLGSVQEPSHDVLQK